MISYAVWLDYRFNLGLRDIVNLLAERGIIFGYESIRRRRLKFGPKSATRVKRKHLGYGNTFDIDEVYLKIAVKQHCFGRAVDQDYEVVDVFLQEQ